MKPQRNIGCTGRLLGSAALLAGLAALTADVPPLLAAERPSVVPGSKPLPLRPGEMGSIDSRSAEEVQAMVVSADGHWALAHGQSPVLHIWDLENGKVVRAVDTKTKVVAAAILPDGKRAVMLQSADNKRSAGELRLIDVATGRALHQYDKTALFSSLTLSGDGKRLFTIGVAPRKEAVQKWEIRLWDTQTNKELARSEQLIAGPIYPSASATGSRFAVWSRDKLLLWEPAKGPKLRELGLTPIRNVQLTPDGKQLLCNGASQLTVWDVNDDKETCRIDMPAPIQLLSVAADGRQAVAGCRLQASADDPKSGQYRGGSLVLIDLEKRTTRVALRAERNKFTGLALLEDGRVISSGTEAKIRLWDARRWPTAEEARAAPPRVFPAVAVPPLPKESPLDALRREALAAHELLIEGDGNGDKAPPQLVAVFGDSELLQPKAATSPRGHTRPVFGLSFSADGKQLASCSDDRTILVWDCATGKPLRQIVKQEALLNCVAFDGDGKRLAVAAQELTKSSAKTVMVWDASTGEQLADISGTKASHSAAFSTDGKWLAYGSQDNIAWSVRVWDTTARRQVLNLEGYPESSFHAVTFCPDGARLAGSTDKGAVIWDLASGEEVMLLGGFRGFGSILSVAFSPDGMLIAAADCQVPTHRAQTKGAAAPKAPRSVKVWETNTGKEVLSLGAGFGLGVYSVAFSPDGKRLATAGIGQPVRVWDVASGKELRALGSAKRTAHVVTFSPDGRHLAVGDERGVVCIYRLEEKP